MNLKKSNSIFKIININQLLVPVFVLFFGSSYAQLQDTSVINKFAKEIRASDLKNHLTELSSDKYAGRETGEEGQRLAATYLAQYYNNIGLKGFTIDYFQHYPISQEKAKESSISFDNKEFKFLEDYFFFPRFDAQELNASEVYFVGYGINEGSYNDYKNLNLRYKVAIILDGEPKDDNGQYVISKSDKSSRWSESVRAKLEEAKNQGLNALLIVDENINQNIKTYKHSIEKPLTKLDGEDNKLKGRIPYFYISKDMAEKLLGKSLKKIKSDFSEEKTLKNTNVKGNLKIKIEREQQKLTAQNVMAFIPGSQFKDEYVVFSAHYDHLGIQDGKIYYGADDDGSGTVAVLELAQAFYESYKNGNGPKRNVLFINFSGEEKGLLGSEYYSKNPIVPLNQTVCDLNIDMIGRLDKEHENNPNYVYIIGSDKLSSDLHFINEEANKKSVNILLDYTYNKPSDPNRFYYRSDHYNFAKNNIPVIFYFTGVHADYHKPTDTVDKIDFNKMEKITRLIFYTAWDIANRNERIKVDKVNDFKSNR